MAQLHRHAQADTSKAPAPTITTVEQLLRGGEASKVSPSSSSSSSSAASERSKQRDTEEDHGHHQKKSVLTKVKERAKKLRSSLSKKKHEDNVTPSLVGDEDDEDTEYLGAPMYESELAPEGYKEKARQHPRAYPVISEKHVLPSSVKSGVVRDKETPLSPTKSKRIIAHPPATNSNPPGPSKTMSDYKVTHTFSSKFQALPVSKPTELQIPSVPTTARKASSATSSPKTPRASQTFDDVSMPSHASSDLVTPQTSLKDKSSSPSNREWDNGVSVKEYLMNKFEPGEDERALSQVISEAMTPKRTPEEKGVMEKVRNAVTSLLRNDEPSQCAVRNPVTQTSFEIPVSTNAYGVGQEESQGRILQAN